MLTLRIALEYDLSARTKEVEALERKLVELRANYETLRMTVARNGRQDSQLTRQMNDAEAKVLNEQQLKTEAEARVQDLNRELQRVQPAAAKALQLWQVAQESIKAQVELVRELNDGR